MRLPAKLVRDWDERRVRRTLALFFLVLAVPAVLLVGQAYRQLRFEALSRAQGSAQELAARVDAELRSAVAREEAHTFADYAFLVPRGDADAGSFARSALAAFPVESAVPGVIGYFQVDAAGLLTTPLLPAGGADSSAYGITENERRARLALEAEIRAILTENHLVPRLPGAVTSAPGTSAPGTAADELASATILSSGSPRPAARQTLTSAPQAAFDRLKSTAALSGAEEARKASPGGAAAADSKREAEPTAATEPRARDAATEPAARDGGTEPATRDAGTEPGTREAAAEADGDGGAASPIRTFESELGRFEVGLLDSGQLVMFRSDWRDGQRYVQGALIDSGGFVRGAVGSVFDGSSLAGMADLVVAYAGTVLPEPTREPPGAARSAARSEGAGAVVYRARLSPPFGDVEVAFAARVLPLPPGAGLLGWLTVTLAAVLSGGFFFMYRFAVGQIRLRRLQQDFVSAVSHELKTPLTSIRMYGEMLMAGWADEARKQSYYEYIHAESERLSRLIENVLQLARLTHRGPQIEGKRVTGAELMDLVRSKIATQAERAGFRVELRNEAEAAEVFVDADAFTQIVINLVDNALKFSRSAERKVIEIACRPERSGGVLLTVRDYGPGIPKGQLKKIFELFYRPMNELTRETVGTGIGLALVRELSHTMGGRVEARNCDPGAEFRVSFRA
jgi:signal transduction histidine kinase